jgi:hypothetical protein
MQVYRNPSLSSHFPFELFGVICSDIDMIATFPIPRDQPRPTTKVDKPKSAWDALRERSQNPQQQQPPQPPKEKDIWGEDK